MEPLSQPELTSFHLTPISSMDIVSVLVTNDSTPASAAPTARRAAPGTSRLRANPQRDCGPSQPSLDSAAGERPARGEKQ